MAVDQSLNAAIEQYTSARRAFETATTPDESKDGARAIYESMSAICKAYATPECEGPFPKDVAFTLHVLLFDLLRGHLPESIKDLIGGGGRSFSFGEQRSVEAACRYVQAARSGLIVDRKPVKNIETWYSTTRKTVQAWNKRYEGIDLLANFLADGDATARGNLIKSAAEKEGATYAKWARSWKAIEQRGRAA